MNEREIVDWATCLWSGARDSTVAYAAVMPPILNFRAKDANSLLGFCRVNMHGDLYATPARFIASSERRAKENVAYSNVLWLDCDDDDAFQNAMRLLPEPTMDVETSEGRHQLFWRMSEPLYTFEIEPILRMMARTTGGDKAATDASRLMRVPGTVNVKRGGFAVTIIAHRPRLILSASQVSELSMLSCGMSDCEDKTCSRVDIEIPKGIDKEAPAEVRKCGGEALLMWSGKNPQHREKWTASERDFALVMRLLRSGVHPRRAGEIIAGSPNRRYTGRRKSDMKAYVSRTVSRAAHYIHTDSGRNDADENGREAKALSAKSR